MNGRSEFLRRLPPPTLGLCALGVSGALCVLAALAGCQSDWRTDGRFWHQPTESAGRRPVSYRVYRNGRAAESGIGPGFTTSGDFGESGGPTVGRGGHTADSSVWPQQSTEVGYVNDRQRYGRYSERTSETGVYGGAAVSSSFDEVAARSGVE